jgi:hypothetical protein
MKNADEIMERCFTQLKEYCAVEAPHHFVLLSGGIDSFVVLAALMQTHKPEDVTAVIINGTSSSDYVKAVRAAEYYGVKISTCNVCVDLLVNEIHHMKGTKDTSLFQSLFRLSAMIALRNLKIDGCFVHTGDGADTLYGNANPFLYRQTPQVAKENKISKTAARELLRKNWRKRVMAGQGGSTTAGIIASVVRSYNGIARQAFVTGEYEYILDVPLELLEGDKKTWVKKGLVLHYGVSVQMAYSRKRCSMQEGSGLMEHFGKWLCEHTGAKTANSAVKLLSA